MKKIQIILELKLLCTNSITLQYYIFLLLHLALEIYIIALK